MWAPHAAVRARVNGGRRIGTRPSRAGAPKPDSDGRRQHVQTHILSPVGFRFRRRKLWGELWQRQQQSSPGRRLSLEDRGGHGPFPLAHTAVAECPQEGVGRAHQRPQVFRLSCLCQNEQHCACLVRAAAALSGCD